MTVPTPQTDDLDQLKRALAALKKARARINTLEQARSEPIAIIGMGCRLPGGCNTPQAFWELLREGRSAITPPPADRWDPKDVESSDPDEPGKIRSSLSGFLERVDQFDPHFFGISPREAHAMDPQQRLALESAWEALEDAGIIPEDLAGSSTGVFIGIGLNDYARLQIPAQVEDRSLVDHYFLQGNALCITPNRISYALDFHGPSMAIDSACSSSMSAIHTACQSLRNGDSSLALVGGTNVLLTPDTSIALAKFLAPDGLCKTFDARANGYTRGEGAIIFVLKRLSEAQADGDRIYAVIRGTSINQDGFSSGLTVPNGSAQEAMLRTALQNAGLEPGDIDYVEAHGTGTSLGDPIEANALGTVFAPGRERGQELLIGSVKTNIGHLEAGAGIAGVMKVALALYHGEIPASLNYERPNPMIDFDHLRLRVVTQRRPWPKREGPNRAGISSFGFGGTNSHAFLESAPAAPAGEITPAAENPRLFTLSAKTPEALVEYARRFADFLQANPGQALAGVCDTANRRRSLFAHRLAAVATSTDGLAHSLAAYASGQPAPDVTYGHAQQGGDQIVFLFTGQGAQYPGMGRALYATEPVFRQALDRCEAVYRQQTGESLLDAVFAPAGEQPAQVDHTAITQPALFAVEIGLAELWRSWGVQPAAVTGHSIGEYVAACVAGVFSLEDGMKLVIARGRLMGALPAGGVMATLFTPPEQVEAALAGRSHVSIAAVNAPDSTVISGDAAEVQAVIDTFQAAGVQSRRLVVSHAFHSPLMEPILDEFERVAATCQFAPPQIPLICNLTGRPFAAGEIPNAAYWRRHIRGAVQFAAGIQSLHALGFHRFLEIGPNPVLTNLGKRTLPEGSAGWVISLRQGQPDAAQMRKSLGALFTLGRRIDWDLVDGAQQRPPVSLPTYPFQNERYWFRVGKAKVRRQQSEQPLLGRRLRSPGLPGPAYETTLDADSLPYLWDHRAYGTPIFPAAAFLDMALSAAALQHDAPPAVEEMTVQETLILPAEGERSLQMLLTPTADDSMEARMYSASEEEAARGAWQLHAYAKISRTAGIPADVPTLDAARAACARSLPADEFYAVLHSSGMEYGPDFQNIRELWLGDSQALARVELQEHLTTAGYRLHPALLDACLQAVGAAFFGSEETFLPIAFDTLDLYREPGRALWSYARIIPGETSESFRADLWLYAPDGALVARVVGMRLKRTAAATLRRLVQRASGRVAYADWLYRMQWDEQPLPQQATAPAPTRWLVYGDEPAAQALAGLIPGCMIAMPGESFQGLDANRWLVSPSNPGDMQALLENTRPDGILCLTGSTQAALHLLQAASVASAPPQVWLVTHGAQPVGSTAGDVHVPAAALWGLARSTRAEFPDLRLHCVDLDPAALPLENARSLWAEVQTQAAEDEVAYRNDRRYAQRMARFSAPAATPPVRLVNRATGELDGLALQPLARRVPGPGEVEIAVRATGLNFRDVLITLGMYPGDAPDLGSECSGVVSAVGEGVTHVRPGDAVLALASDCFATYALTRAEFALPKPPEMIFDQAAGIPIAFLTADYALNTLGHMQPGERVLIHAAAGGVGMAAVQLARLAGAEIFATAGSPEKRAMLRALGVQHVLDSRTLDFSDEILRLTDGEGVHLVLNSLADEFIPRSLAVTAQGGRFLEIGKRGIWSHAQVDALGKDIAYHIIYLGGVCESDPRLIHALFEKLMQHFASGALRPLPVRVFPLEQASEAFRFMAKARHTGKIVLSQAAQPSAAPSLRKDATYLVTGGLGGIGLTLARQMAEMGAGTLVLAGLREPGPEAQTAIDAMQRECGAQVRVLVGDLALPGAVPQALEQIRREQPLVGIVHAAGVLDDGILAQQTWQRYEGVFAPKLDLAWELHRRTLGMPLDFFVLFSAGAGWLGTPAQSGYAAANTAVDALAAYRLARGLPAVSIAWGPWADVGMAARMSEADRERMRRQGLGSISPADGALAFAHLLGAAGPVAVLPLDWERFAEAQPRMPARFSALASQAQSAAAARPAAPTADIRKTLADAPQSKRRALLQGHLREHAARVLGLNADFHLDNRQPLREIGMDSLMAVELRNAISASLKQKLPATLLFDYPTVEALTAFLSGMLWPEQPAAPQAAEPSKPTGADVQNLSDEEAEALLLAELDKNKPK